MGVGRSKKKVRPSGLAPSRVCDRVHACAAKSPAPERRRQAAIGDGMARRDSNMESRYHNLKTRQRQERCGYPDSLSVRVHRVLNWLDRVEQEVAPGSRFIFLRLVLGVIYIANIDGREDLREHHVFNAFQKKIQALDNAQWLNRLVWNAYWSVLRGLLGNPCVLACSCNYQKGLKTEGLWKQSFESAKKAANYALPKQDIPRLLVIVISGIYNLHNKLVHGSATWRGGFNRDQSRGCINSQVSWCRRSLKS